MAEDFINGVGERSETTEKRRHQRYSIPVLIGVRPVNEDDANFYLRNAPFNAIQHAHEAAETISQPETDMLKSSLGLANVSDQPLQPGEIAPVLEREFMLHAIRSMQVQRQFLAESLRSLTASIWRMIRVPSSLSLSGIFIPCPPSWVGMDELGERTGPGLVSAGDCVQVAIFSDRQDSPPIPAYLVGRIKRVTHTRNGDGIPDEYGIAIEFQSPKETQRRDVLRPIIGEVL